MLRLLRLRLRKWTVSSPRKAPPVLRIESPSGGSTLITSAPKSANNIVASGPAISCEKSSTRSPCSAGVIPNGPRKRYQSCDQLAAASGERANRDVGFDVFQRLGHIPLVF